MSFNDVSPEEFIKTIVNTTHKNYSNHRKHIHKGRIIKLIIKISEDLDYEGFSSGLYKHGHYSFYVNDVLYQSGFQKSLHGAKINKSEIDEDLVEIVTPLIVKSQNLFLSRNERFMDWAHYERVPDEYKDFYEYGDILLNNIQNDLPKIRNKAELTKYYDKISDTITNLENCLGHVNSDNLKFYFSYVDYLENILLVCKVRDFKFREVKSLLKDMSETYYHHIYSFLPPFEQTLDSQENKEFERRGYEEAMNRAKENASRLLPKIEDQILTYNLEPTIEELDNEIKREFERSDDDTRKEFICIMNQNYL